MATLDDMTALCDAGDHAFGPAVAPGCRGGFDFTLCFEQAILSMAPAAILLLLFPFRLARLRRAKPTIRPDWACLAKLCAATIFAALQVACLTLWARAAPESRPSTAIPAPVLVLAAALAVVVLSYFEHTRSLRPSIILGAFLSLTLLFDAAIVRTLWLRGRNTPLAAATTTSLSVKAVLLVLESQPKAQELLPGKEKRRSLEAESGPYSLGFFWWLNQLFLHGFRKNLALDDLSALEDDFFSDILERRIRNAWTSSEIRSRQRSRKPGWVANQKRRRALFFAICSALKYPLLVPVPARLAFTVFSFAQPFLITAVIQYVQSPVTESSRSSGYGLIGAAALVYLGIAISRGQYNYRLYRSVTKLRGCLIGLIYHKTLGATASATKASAALTLMSADVDRIALTAEKVYEMWAGTIEVAIAIWLLERQIGWACIAPLVLAAVSFVGNTTIAKVVPGRLKQWNKATQDRVALTATVLRNMPAIKATGQTPAVFDTVQDARTHELDRSAHFRQLVALMNLFGALPKLLAAPLTFTIFVFSAAFFTEGGLGAARAFTTLSLLELLTTPLGNVLQSIPQVTAAFGCLDRIQDYLRLDDYQAMPRYLPPAPSPPAWPISKHPATEKSVVDLEIVEEDRNTAIELADVSLRYAADGEYVLRDLSLHVATGELVMVVGPAGCGKTTLLRAVAGELTPARGNLARRQAQIAYCQQTPWLQNTTVRANIVGKSPDDEAWYRKVRALCALDVEDALEALPDGDEVVGSGGIALSGGQKKRLALARAVYARKPVVVLDDVLSGLDPKTESSIFQALVAPGGLLRQGDTTVIMVTNSMRHLASADVILSMNADGTTTQYKSVSEMGHAAADIESALGTTAADDKKAKPAAAQAKRAAAKTPQALSKDKKKARSVGDIRCYQTYGQSMGWSRAWVFLGIAVLFAVVSRISQVWVTSFTDNVTINRGLFIGIYFLFALSAIVLSLISFWWMMIVIIPVSGSNLHKLLLTAVLGAPLSFFTSTDVGVILNRFSQDMNYATAYLPISTMNSVTTVLVCITQFALIASGSGYLAIALPLLVFAVYLLQKFYLATSRQLRFLDLEYKSPLYTALTETIEGLPTIRAFGWTRSYEAQFLRSLDDSQRPVYMLYCIQRWLSLVLDLIVAALAVLLIAFATQLRSTTSGPTLGLAMVNVLGFGQSLSQFIFFYTELETSLGAIARIREYVAEIVPEDGSPPSISSPNPNDNNKPAPDGWPARGDVMFDNISASYGSKDDPPVLQDVSLYIPAGQIVGIAGRTGSGKSSLTLALLRLLDLRTGVVSIDGVDISTLPRQAVRSRITTVPQDPFFPPTHSLRRTLAGTAAANLSNAQILAALDNVGLLQHVVAQLAGDSDKKAPTNLTTDSITLEVGARILDAQIDALPLSAGQQQQFCLARALLQDNKIVILDEFTSAIDAATEDKLRVVIKTELRGKTVLMVAHHPSMLEICDVVVEIDGGRVISVVTKKV